MRSPGLWIGLGLFGLLLRLVLTAFPGVVEQAYSRALFPFLRVLLDYGMTWLPIPWIYPVGALLLYLLFRAFRPLFQKSFGWRVRLGKFLGRTAALLGGAYFFFLLLWGFNYLRQPLEEQMAFEMSPLSNSELWEALERETEVLAHLRSTVPHAPDSLAIELDWSPQMEEQLREGLGNWLVENGFPAPGRIRAKRLLPKGIFLRFSSAGMYFPFSGEGYADAGLHPLQLVAVSAHEMGHAYGFGDEGTCNFLSYVGCLNTEDPFLRYAGQLGYWRTLAINCRRSDPEKYLKFREQLPAGIRADLNTINAHLQLYPDLMPRVRDAAYNTYLKAQGIQEGMANYNRVLMLVKAWRKVRRS